MWKSAVIENLPIISDLRGMQSSQQNAITDGRQNIFIIYRRLQK